MMTKLPDMIFVVDTKREDLAVLEANKLGVPILAVVDTNCDPDPINYIIPGNDDAIRAVKLLTKVIADAAEEGQRFREVDMADTGSVSNRELAEMEQYLGPSTLAKLQSAEDEDTEVDPYADHEDTGAGDTKIEVAAETDVVAEAEVVTEAEDATAVEAVAEVVEESVAEVEAMADTEAVVEAAEE